MNRLHIGCGKVYRRFKDRTGQQFGELTVLHFSKNNLRGQANWMCQCSCGNTREVFGGNLHSGHTTSCGCRKGLLKHGENKINARSAEYQTLAGIISRCTNPKCKSWHLYGGRGITVCERWNSVSKIENFVADVGRRPTDAHSIDRWPDKNGNYEPGNVRWATDWEQASNTRKNIYHTFRGETLHELALVRKFSVVSQSVFRSRLKRGWGLESALLILPIKNGQKFAHRDR